MLLGTLGCRMSSELKSWLPCWFPVLAGTYHERQQVIVSTLVPTSHAGDLKGVCDSWLQHGAVLALCACGEEPSRWTVCLSLFFTIISLPFRYMNTCRRSCFQNLNVKESFKVYHRFLMFHLLQINFLNFEPTFCNYRLNCIFNSIFYQNAWVPPWSVWYV